MIIANGLLIAILFSSDVILLNKTLKLSVLQCRFVKANYAKTKNTEAYLKPVIDVLFIFRISVASGLFEQPFNCPERGIVSKILQ